MVNKRGQLTIFIIIAIVIVAAIGGYFLIRGSLGVEKIPVEFQPVYDYFLSCIEVYGEEGARILGQQAGYIYAPEFEPGSEYRPFSSQLDFLGLGVPYWYYVSGNNIIKEQIPSKNDMEKELERYLEENLECDFSKFEEQGFGIERGENKIRVKINENEVRVFLDSDLTIERGEERISVSSHEVGVESKLGKFYDIGLKIYNKEKQNMFLEDYAVDVLRLYAPVDGVEMTCSPKIWMKHEVDEVLKEALEANIQAIKLKGDYYQPVKEENKYFIQDIETDEAVNFLYSRDWPTRIEVWKSQNGIMIAEPVGMQPGLGVLGFCYVPYHFVYDLNFPVLIQIYDGYELFQFPVSVIIEKNKQREALPGTSVESAEELCLYKNQEITVYTYDTNLGALEADIDFECLRERCDIGKTEIKEDEAVLIGLFPQCGNGFITADADGYARERYQFSTNEEGSVDIILDKEYELDVEFKINSEKSSDYAIISFSGENTYSVFWPEQKSIKLSEGMYNVSVYAYKNSSIIIPGIKKEYCNDVPKQGLLGILGVTEEKCFDIDIPSQTLNNIVSGGGKGEEYITEMQLEKGKVIINVPSIKLPKSLEELQDAYNLLELNPVYIDFENE